MFSSLFTAILEKLHKQKTSRATSPVYADSMTQDSNQYQVAIAGGGIAGVTLALICEKLDIDYVLLEARDTIESDRGAGIGLQPNGLRILDQLGVLEEIEEATVPLTRWYSYDGNGELMSDSKAMGLYREKVGYSVMFIERRKLLPILFKRVTRRECIKTSSRVTSVVENEDGVVVTTANGISYSADLVIGADGVRSAVRTFIDSASPDSKVVSADDYLSVSFATVYGMSAPTEGIATGERFAVYREKQTIIGFTGKDGIVFWFVFEQLSQSVPLSQAPRFTAAHAEALCESVADVRVMPNLKFGALYANRTVDLKIAVEEGVAQTWNTDRAVIVGDAACKTTPAGGQGANQAIESCAVLMNEYVKTRKENGNSKTLPRGAIRSVLESYKEKRTKAAAVALQRSQLIAQALFCFPGQPTIMAKVMTSLSDEEWLGRAFMGLSDAPVLEHIDLTPRGELYAATVRKALANAKNGPPGPPGPPAGALTNNSKPDSSANMVKAGQQPNEVKGVNGINGSHLTNGANGLVKVS